MAQGFQMEREWKVQESLAPECMKREQGSSYRGKGDSRQEPELEWQEPELPGQGWQVPE
jgi:hypothetical protein